MPALNHQTFVNGKIFTARSEEEFVSAFTIGGGKITWVGDGREVDDSAAIDLQGQTVLPGFIDVHTHPTWVGMILNAVPCTVPVVNSIPEMIEALKSHSNFGKSEDHWIEGFGYDESKLAEHRTPTTKDLDLVSTTQPVYVMRSDCHSAVCNSRALAIAQITKDTPDPKGARFGRYENGEPNGILQEFAAKDAVLRVKTAPSYHAKVNSVARTGAHYHERGIVAFTDMMTLTRPFDDLQVYRDAEKQGLRQQAALYFDWSTLKQNQLRNLTDEQRKGRIKWAGVKLFADGSISGRTAWVREAYRNSKDHGYSTVSDEDLLAAYKWPKRNRLQVAVHAMGDKATERVIEFFADKEPWLGDHVPSVRLEHVTLLTDEQMRRMNDGKMIFGAATQIIFFFAEYDSYWANLRPAQFQRAYPIKSLYDQIEHLGLSSDAPATTWADPDNVFVSMKAAVTRKAYNGADIVSEQAITVPQAVLLYTARAARVAPFEGLLGQIAPSFEGSFIVLDRDIFNISPDEIDRTRVKETWIAGEKVYERN
ncbi:MAG TPA: amidohydrolase [Chthoniobacterales bacterium]|nr:amidohydrolase [Chthoniobacterales bacterium]